MASVDFSQWAEPDLVLRLGGVRYTSPPPSVDQARELLALTIRAEVSLGLALPPVPESVLEVLAEIDRRGGELADLTLGEETHALMKQNGVPLLVLNRMAYYALFYWSRGKERADWIASALWTPKDDDDEGAGDSPGEAPSR